MIKPFIPQEPTHESDIPFAAFFIGLAWASIASAQVEPQASVEPSGRRVPQLLFSEGFDDAQLLERGWYDGDRFAISAQGARAGKGCIEYHWKAGGTTPDSSSGMRRLFEPTETVYLRCYIKLSKGWGWTGRSYHPHLMHFMTTENGKYHGPGRQPSDRLHRAAGGQAAAGGPGHSEQGRAARPHAGPAHGRLQRPSSTTARTSSSRDDQWHCVEAMFQLNSLDLKADKPNADGIVRGWFDGKLVIDRTDVVLRSTDFPKMKFNQFLLTPYFGPGLLPHEQTLWIDELAVGSARVGPIK